MANRGNRAGLLPLPHVQFWQAEDSWRLDRSHRRSRTRDIPRLVAAAALCAVMPALLARGSEIGRCPQLMGQ